MEGQNPAFEEVPAGLDARFHRAGVQAPEFLGLTPEGAQALALAKGVTFILVLSFDEGPVRMFPENNDRQLTLLVQGRTVVSAAYF